jgi:hypothetical protein
VISTAAVSRGALRVAGDLNRRRGRTLVVGPTFWGSAAGGKRNNSSGWEDYQQSVAATSRRPGEALTSKARHNRPLCQ